MVTVRLTQPDGTISPLRAAPGLTLMEAAVREGIDGIDADCGGALSCATCHVHIALDWADRLPAPSADELEMLEYVADRSLTSRLSCQVILEERFDGLTASVPRSQRR